MLLGKYVKCSLLMWKDIQVVFGFTKSTNLTVGFPHPSSPSLVSLAEGCDNGDFLLGLNVSKQKLLSMPTD